MSYFTELKQLEALDRADVGTEWDKLDVVLNSSLELYDEYFKSIASNKWFFRFKDNNYFDPSRIRYGDDGHALFWAVLYYLERLSRQATQGVDGIGVYDAELIHIIDDIFQESKARRESVGKPINHMHIWWFCIKIINNIPNDAIKNALPLGTFKAWLWELSNVREANDLAMHEISEKLLGKFIADESTISYAEAIIDVITGLRDNPSPRKLLGDRDALLIMDSYWLLEAFKDRSGTIAASCSQAAVYGLADKLKSALEYERSESRIIIYIGTECYQIKLERVPCEGRTDSRVCFEPAKYQCVVGQYSKNQLDAAKDTGGDFALYYEVPEAELQRYQVDGDTCDDVRAAVEKGLPKEINWHKAEGFTDNLKSLYSGLFEDFSHIWYESLAGEGVRANTDSKEALTSIFKDVLLARCEARRSEAREILETLLSDRYRFPLFKRIVLLCVDKYWGDYLNVFQRFIDREDNVLRGSEWERELHNLLRNHCLELGEGQMKRLKELIDDIPDYYREKGKKFEAHWKYKWLSPLKDNPDFAALYEEAKGQAEITEDKPYEPGASAFKGGFVGNISPLSPDEIASKDIPDLIQYLRDFKGADEWGMLEGKPDRDGLAETLQSAIKTSPEKYIGAIESFMDVPYLYVCRIMKGLNEAWKEKKALDWSAIFEFSIKYLSKKTFMDEAFAGQGEDSGGGRYIWFIDALADLIESGSRDDEHAFPSELFPKVDDIFNAVYPFLKGEENPDTQKDALTYSLNTTLGRTVQAFIIYSLRVKRIDKKDKADRCADWGAGKYERYLSKGIEAYVWFGRYLPHIRFIDQGYVEDKVKELAARPSDNTDWRMFMEGYLSGAHVYDDVYALMRPHYMNAIVSAVFDDNIDKRLVEHISIGYLRGHEALNDESFFRMLLDGAATPEKRKRWLAVAGYFWSISDRTLRKKEYRLDTEPSSQETIDRVIEFWKWTYKEREKIEALLGDDYDDFLGRMADLTIYLDKLDNESGEWLLLAAPYAGRHRMTSFLVEYLTKFEDDESLRWIGRIYVKILEQTTPTFRKEDIECVVKRLYELGKKEPEVKKNADDICNTYGRRGEHFLRGLFDEYNP